MDYPDIVVLVDAALQNGRLMGQGHRARQSLRNASKSISSVLPEIRLLDVSKVLAFEQKLIKAKSSWTVNNKDEPAIHSSDHCHFMSQHIRWTLCRDRKSVV